MRLTSLERRFEGLEVGLNDLIGHVEGAADEAQHRVRLLSLLLLGDDVVQPAGVDGVRQKFLQKFNKIVICKNLHLFLKLIYNKMFD